MKSICTTAFVLLVACGADETAPASPTPAASSTPAATAITIDATAPSSSMVDAAAPTPTTSSSAAIVSVADAGAATIVKGCGKSPRGGSLCAEEGRECNYASGASCMCAPVQCFSAAGPIPNCVPVAEWQCRDDGCPMRLSGACKREGQKCDSDNGLCVQPFMCKSGRWTPFGQGQCRPAAPPHG